MGQPRANYLFPFACFECRRSFKRPPRAAGQRKCPHCGGTAMMLDRRFAAPAQHDAKQWNKIRYLYEHGFRFATVYDVHGLSVEYPRTMAEAVRFAEKYGLSKNRQAAGLLHRVTRKQRRKRIGQG